MTRNGLLHIESLSVRFPTPEGLVRATDGVNLTLEKGESCCLVGESGCGKTIVAMAIMRLLPCNALMSGQILFKGRDLLPLSERSMRAIRGRDIAMIFEQPTAYLNPVFTIGDQIAEAVRIRDGLSRRNAKAKAIDLLDRAGIPSPDDRCRQYPHQLSGGMNQRVMIAMVLALNPALLIADEPKTALDTTVQCRIIDLLKRTVEELGTTFLLITHDYEVASALCTNATVMYAGQIVETGSVERVFANPRHPYTRAMINALRGDVPRPIPGQVPSLCHLPCGCRFHPRCQEADVRCRVEAPAMENRIRCHLN